MPNNYDVGYRKPPEDSKFKPGQSGNSKGRPRKRKEEGMFDLLNKELKSKLTLKDGSKITKAEAAIRQLCNKASGGDFKSGKLILDITTKQQANTLALEFLNKLIKENYITESNVKDYLNSGKILGTKSMPAALYNMYKGANIKRAAAFEWLKNILIISRIWEAFVLAFFSMVIWRRINEELCFWEGVDATLDCLQIDERQREHVISNLEKGRDYKRPSYDLYNTAFDIWFFMMRNVELCMTVIRDASKRIEGYKEQEKEFFNEEYQQDVLSIASSEMMPSELKIVKEELERYKDSYEMFCGAPDLFKTKSRIILKENFKKEEIEEVLKWYRSDILPEE
ncbi:MAG: DUF5681 domain-containing protein [Syntrophomonadaceae bacterium]|jgi:hypothetical protein|nr:DUF5681 domain-containing protein [Syntrophomonadaceae bacterium]